MAHYLREELADVFVRVFAPDEARGQIFQGVEEAIEVHLRVVALAYDVLIDYVVVGLQQAIVG